MDIMRELRADYGYDSPIFLKEIEIKGMSADGLRQTLARLVKKGEIERYSQGVYYIPRMTLLGKSTMSAQKVYEKKYITNNNEIYGYYAGLALENAIGLTTQIPNIIEIVTNNESSGVRVVRVGNQKLRLRRSRVVITKSNVKILQFLDLMKRKDWRLYSDAQQETIISYIRKLEIKADDLYKYVRYYPARAAKNVLESRLADELIR